MVANASSSTAVIAGMMYMADNPDILSTKEVPLSLWLRSDPDGSTNEDDDDSVIRICTQGQDVNDSQTVLDRLSASHPIHYELLAPEDEPPSLDLSVFGTPAGVSDEQIIEGWNHDKFAFTNAGKVTEFGRFERQLPGSTVALKRRVCHVYLYAMIFKFKVEFYATFASDGRPVKALEKTPFEDAFHEGELAPKWQRHKGINLSFVKLRQVARSELLQKPQLQQDSPAPTGQRSEALTALVSPSDTTGSPSDNVRSGSGSKKRKSTLQRMTLAQRRKLITSSTTKRTPLMNRQTVESRSADEENESGMDMSTSLASD